MLIVNTEFNIDLIVSYLKGFSNNVEKYYNWKLSEKILDELLEMGGITKNQLLEIKNENTNFKQNVLLKMVIAKNFKSYSNGQVISVSDWVVKRWGGISSLKTSIFDIVQAQKDNLKHETSEFKRVSSYSKVLSFMDPANYIIYDSRVAFSINWIILKSSCCEKYFKNIPSRNTKITAFDMDTIINLNFLGIHESQLRSKQRFIDENKSYITMCRLIKEVNNKLFNDDRVSYPFYTEMLLFGIADNEIINDINNSCQLSVKKVNLSLNA